MNSSTNEAPFLSKVGKSSTFLINLAVVLGGLISFGWLVGSLLLYWKLDRSVWELASLVVVSFFVFTWFCVRELSRRSVRALAGKPEYDDSEQEEWESKKQLEGQLAEIEERLREAKRGHKKKIIQELEMAREDILSQLERFELEDKVKELKQLRNEASAFGRGREAREYSEEINKYESKLKERGDMLEDLPPFPRVFAYMMLAGSFIIIGLLHLLVPLFMLLITAFFWEMWAGGSEWLRAPEGMTTVIAVSLTLTCVWVRIVSWHFSPKRSKKEC